MMGVATCQFCGEDLRGAAPVQKRSIFLDPDNHDVVHTGGRPKWVYPLYYTISGYFLVSGLVALILTLVNPNKSEFANILMYVSAGISIVLGLGLLGKVEIIRGIVNFVCGLRVFFGLLNLPGALAGLLGSTFFGILGLIFAVLDIVLNGFMIYLIGETD